MGRWSSFWSSSWCLRWLCFMWNDGCCDDARLVFSYGSDPSMELCNMCPSNFTTIMIPFSYSFCPSIALMCREARHFLIYWCLAGLFMQCTLPHVLVRKGTRGLVCRGTQRIRQSLSNPPFGSKMSTTWQGR